MLVLAAHRLVEKPAAERISAAGAIQILNNRFGASGLAVLSIQINGASALVLAAREEMMPGIPC